MQRTLSKLLQILAYTKCRCNAGFDSELVCQLMKTVDRSNTPCTRPQIIGLLNHLCSSFVFDNKKSTAPAGMFDAFTI